MRATLMYGAGDVRIENVPDAHPIEPTDALVVVTRAAICGSDLWQYKGMPPSETGRLDKEFGATHIVSERGEEAVARVRELTHGFGARSVLERVGYEEFDPDCVQHHASGQCGWPCRGSPGRGDAGSDTDIL